MCGVWGVCAVCGGWVVCGIVCGVFACVRCALCVVCVVYRMWCLCVQSVRVRVCVHALGKASSAWPKAWGKSSHCLLG